MIIMAKTWKDINYDRMVSMTRIEQAVWDAGEDKRSTVSYQKYAESPELKKDLHEDLVHLRYRTYRDGFQELRKSSYLRFRRSVHRVDTRARCSVSQARSILSRNGIVGKTNCQRLKTNIDATVKKYRMRRIVSNADKQKEQRLAS
jgi:hypothetical protein